MSADGMSPSRLARSRCPVKSRLREGGFALLVVLWTVALLSLLVDRFATTARNEATRAAALRAAAQASAVADGLVDVALFHLLDNSTNHWLADGQLHPVDLPRGAAVVTITDHAGRINPNGASPVLLAALLRRLGESEARARQIATSVSEWSAIPGTSSWTNTATARYLAAGLTWGPPGEPFATIDELSLVMGMTPDLLASARPYLTVYTDGRLNIANAAPLVAQALADLGAIRPPVPTDKGTLLIAEIHVDVTWPGASVVRNVVARIDPRDLDGRFYRLLSWD